MSCCETEDETMGIRGLERFKQDCDALQLALQGLEQSASPETQLTATLVKAMLERYHRIVVCAEEGKPFIATAFGNAPELFVALDLPGTRLRCCLSCRPGYHIFWSKSMKPLVSGWAPICARLSGWASAICRQDACRCPLHLSACSPPVTVWTCFIRQSLATSIGAKYRPSAPTRPIRRTT